MQSEQNQVDDHEVDPMIRARVLVAAAFLCSAHKAMAGTHDDWWFTYWDPLTGHAIERTTDGVNLRFSANTQQDVETLIYQVRHMTEHSTGLPAKQILLMPANRDPHTGLPPATPRWSVYLPRKGVQAGHAKSWLAHLRSVKRTDDRRLHADDDSEAEYEDDDEEVEEEDRRRVSRSPSRPRSRSHSSQTRGRSRSPSPSRY